MKSITFAFALCFAAFAVGCSNSTTPATNNNTNNSSRIPAVGTTFQTVDLDNASSVTYDTLEESSVSDTMHIGSTVLAVHAYGKGPLTTYQSYLANGDIAIRGAIWAPQFKVLPFASHITVRDTFWDGTAVDSIVAAYNGPGANFTINGKSYPTDSVTVSYIYTLVDFTYQENYSYIPALGVLAYDRSENNGGGTFQKLASYGTD